MKIYKLSLSVEIPIIGTRPQIAQDWTNGPDFWGECSYTQTPLKGRIEFPIIFPRFELAERAKLTDWVGSVNLNRNYFMISTRLWTLLQQFNLDEYQYFPAPIHTPNGVVDYHLIYFVWPRGDDFIDWEKSRFRRTLSDQQSHWLQFPGSKERGLANNGHEIDMEQLVIRHEKITVDIFRMRSFKAGFYVSERLKDAMEADGMTGIVYEPVEWFMNNVNIGLR